MESLGDILKQLAGPKAATSAGAPGPAPEETFDCPVCRDARFVHPQLPTGKPDYSRVVPCECASRKFQEDRQDLLHRYSNLGPLADRTFDSFVPQKMPAVVAAARAFAASPEGWLALVGPSGSGKTHLAAAIANHRLSLGQPAMFISVSDLLDHLRSTFHPTSTVSYDILFEKVRNTPLLILDDLGHQSATPWSTEKLDQIINHRFNMKLPTVFTTSFPPEDLGERWATRLRDPALSRVLLLSRPVEEPSEEMEGLEHLRHMTFENFKGTRNELLQKEREALEMACNQARDFARQPEGWLVLEGAHGCGKTHLAAAIANARLAEGQPVRLMFIPDLLDHLRSTFSGDSKISYDEFFEKLKKSPLLILDDVGGHTTTPWAQEKLFQLINYRYSARLPTVFTIARREDLDERLRSRLDDRSLVLDTPPLTKPYYSNDEAPEQKNGQHGSPGRGKARRA